MKKHIILLLALFWCLLLVAQEHSFPLPQFMSPVYNSFTRNYLSVRAAGSGYTGASKLGGIDQTLLNPAAYLMDEGSAIAGINVKPEIGEFDISGESKYTAPIPIGIIAAGGRLSDSFGTAFVYSVPKSIVYDDFSVVLGQGASLLQRFPSYHLHQLTANLSYHQDNFHVGLNLHNQIHSLDDMIIFRTFDRVRKQKYMLRPELGMLYEIKGLNIGFAVMAEQDFTLETRYQDYESVLPLKLSGGLSYLHDNKIFSVEADYEKNSSISADYDDELILKLGYEARIKRITYRLGVLSYNGVFEGGYVFPVNNTASADTSYYWNEIPSGGTIDETDAILITGGFSFHHKAGSVDLAIMQDVKGLVPITQINLSLQLYLSTFKRKELLF